MFLNVSHMVTIIMIPHSKSGWRLEQRAKEHKRAMARADFNSSAIAEHAWVNGHPIDWTKVKVLLVAHDLGTRVLQEAFAIRTSKDNFNRDGLVLATRWVWELGLASLCGNRCSRRPLYRLCSLTWFLHHTHFSHRLLFIDTCLLALSFHWWRMLSSNQNILFYKTRVIKKYSMSDRNSHKGFFSNATYLSMHPPATWRGVPRVASISLHSLHNNSMD